MKPTPIGEIPKEAIPRFWSKVSVGGRNDCWEWTGGRVRGYGMFRLRQDKWVYAHRLAYTLMIGEVSLNLTIDHLCRNRPCCNAKHMEPVTNQVNTLRGDTLAAKEAAQTHCKRGHELTPTNVYLHGGTRRECIQCRRMRQRGYNAKYRSPTYKSHSSP
ncbi:MAG: HNH endonuclease [Candidatus Brocadiales bacterium]|nr:HNH endonuclease [Candidatus Bathyanammoxibius sp.]